MATLATYLQPAAPGRVLKAKPVAHLLRRHRLIMYGLYAKVLQEFGMLARMRELWRELFPEEQMPGREYIHDLALELPAMVDAHLFPVDLRFMDGLVDGESDLEEIMAYPVPYQSYGIAWEEELPGDLEPWAQPLMALLWPYLGLDNHARRSASEWAFEWWSDRVPFPEEFDWFVWIGNHDEAIAILELLPTPFDGLAVAYQCLLRNSGNPFLDDPDPQWRWIVECEEEFQWEVSDLRRLAEFYTAAKAEISRLQAYITWFETTPDADEHIARLFLSMESGDEQLYYIPPTDDGDGDAAADVHTWAGEGAGRPLWEVFAEWDEEENDD